MGWTEGVAHGWQVRPDQEREGSVHFNLKAGNGETIASSETYNSKAAAKNGIDSVKANAAGATIDDQTGEK